jgi:hypothetical protein|tara:strand:+ start:750 stop:1178 length:429 start_codon:yes stop_codon:yes gene_type:complete
MKKVNKFISYFVLTVYLFAGSGVAEGFVVCIGADNHRAVEPLHEVHLDFPSTSPYSPPSHPGFSQEANHKDTCRDFPISLTDLDQEIILYKSPGSITITPDIGTFSGSVVIQAKGTGTKHLSSYPSATKLTLTSLRTIILQV